MVAVVEKDDRLPDSDVMEFRYRSLSTSWKEGGWAGGDSMPPTELLEGELAGAGAAARGGEGARKWEVGVKAGAR